VTRFPAVLIAAACLLGLAACGGSGSPTSIGRTPRASTPASQQTALAQFASAYVRFLDGNGTASRLPDATAAVRRLANRAGSIPAARRRGTLVMTQLHRAAGERNSYFLSARDDAHLFYVQLGLADQHGRSIVAQLTPPDFVQVLTPPAPPPTPPNGSAAALDAAERFLAAYLPWLYRQAPLRAADSATSTLLTALRAHPPRVPPAIRTLRPRVAAIGMQRDGRSWQALANISDGHEAFELVLAHTHGRWLVTAASSPR
jgi:hypothetical protein